MRPCSDLFLHLKLHLVLAGLLYIKASIVDQVLHYIHYLRSVKVGIVNDSSIARRKSQ